MSPAEKDKPDAETETLNPTARILLVADTLSLHGPLTLDEMQARLGFSRAAVWRALTTLRTMNWVRMRNGDNAYLVQRALMEQFVRARHSHEASDTIERIFLKVKEFGDFTIEFGAFDALGHCTVVETSKKDGYADVERSMTDDDIAIAAQLTFDPKQLVMHLKAFCEMASDEEGMQVRSGEHNVVLRKVAQTNLIWGPDRISVSVPLFKQVPKGCAVLLEQKSPGKASQSGLAAAVSWIQSEFW